MQIKRRARSTKSGLQAHPPIFYKLQTFWKFLTMFLTFVIGN